MQMQNASSNIPKYTKSPHIRECKMQKILQLTTVAQYDLNIQPNYCSSIHYFFFSFSFFDLSLHNSNWQWLWVMVDEQEDGCVGCDGLRLEMVLGFDLCWCWVTVVIVAEVGLWKVFGRKLWICKIYK